MEIIIISMTIIVGVVATTSGNVMSHWSNTCLFIVYLFISLFIYLEASAVAQTVLNDTVISE
jgi:hypothetical protein